MISDYTRMYALLKRTNSDCEMQTQDFMYPKTPMGNLDDGLISSMHSKVDHF